MDGSRTCAADVWLTSLATAVPPHRLDQRDAARMAHQIGRVRDFDRIAPVFETTGVRGRNTVQPPEWYLAGNLDWPKRTRAYLEGAEVLFVGAATRALEAAGLGANDIDVVVTISSTGIATPSVEARVASRMGFRADVGRVPVFGLGCAGGVSGLAIASRLAAARPGTRVLMVALEICTTAFRADQLTKAASSPRHCSATATRLASCARAKPGLPASKARASTCGRARSTSWAGMSMTRAWA